MKLGILGGSFNPIHTAHLIIAQAAIDSLQLDKVLFIPTNITPHKSSRNLIDSRHRLQMIKKATKDNPNFSVSDIEIERGGTSFTIDTLKSLKKKYPKSTFYLLIGSDSIKDLPKWKDINQIVKLANIVVAARPDFNHKNFGTIDIKYTILKIPLLEISSSNIRERIKRCSPIKYLVPSVIEHYIIKNKLYK